MGRKRRTATAQRPMQGSLGSARRARLLAFESRPVPANVGRLGLVGLYAAGTGVAMCAAAVLLRSATFCMIFWRLQAEEQLQAISGPQLFTFGLLLLAGLGLQRATRHYAEAAYPVQGLLVAVGLASLLTAVAVGISVGAALLAIVCNLLFLALVALGACRLLAQFNR